MGKVALIQVYAQVEWSSALGREQFYSDLQTEVNSARSKNRTIVISEISLWEPGNIVMQQTVL